MGGVTVYGPLFVDVGVTVDAAVGTGVVGTDVGAFITTAFLAGGDFFEGRSGRIEQLADDVGIDAVRLEDPVTDQVIAAAGVHCHAMRGGYIGQHTGQPLAGGQIRILDVLAISILEFGEISLHLAVQTRETEITAFRGAL